MESAKRPIAPTETILYGVRIGQPDYMEEILTTHPDRVEDAKAWANENGFDRFRIASHDGSPPDFAAAVLFSARSR